MPQTLFLFIRPPYSALRLVHGNDLVSPSPTGSVSHSHVRMPTTGEGGLFAAAGGYLAGALWIIRPDKGPLGY